jgi:hypothetical protein
MGALGKRSGVVAMVVVLLGVCAAGAHGALEVHNSLNQTFTVFYPPEQACCAHCSPGVECPQFCRVCSDVVVKPKCCATLDSRAGPYPLKYLKVQTVAYYCVGTKDLKLLTARALLAVSSVQCGSDGSGLAASIAQITYGTKACASSVSVKNLGVICLEQC